MLHLILLLGVLVGQAGAELVVLVGSGICIVVLCFGFEFLSFLTYHDVISWQKFKLAFATFDFCGVEAIRHVRRHLGVIFGGDSGFITTKAKRRLGDPGWWRADGIT